MSANVCSTALRRMDQAVLVTPELVTASETSFTSVIDTIQNSPLLMPIINAVGGLFGALYGANLTYKGFSETRQAAQCGDKKGVVNGLANTGIGVTFAGMGAAMCGNGVADALPILQVCSTEVSQILIKIFTTVMNWLGLALYTFYIVGAVAALPDLRAFRNEFNAMLDQPRICPKTKAQESLQFLQAQISLTPQDRLEMNGMPPEAAVKKLQMKQDLLIRRVGSECAKQIERELPQLLQEVRDGKLENTEKLLALVARRNFKQTVAQICMLVAGILGVVGSVFAIVALGGCASYVLFASASILYWLNSPIGDMTYRIYAPSTDAPRICYKPNYAII